MVGEAVRLKYRCLLAKKSKKEAFTVGERDWRKEGREEGKSGATQTHNKALMSRLVRAPSSRACERRARAEGRGVVAAPRFMEKALWGWWSLDVRGKIPQSFSLPLSLSLFLGCTCREDKMLLEYQWLSFLEASLGIDLDSLWDGRWWRWRKKRFLLLCSKCFLKLFVLCLASQLCSF